SEIALIKEVGTSSRRRYRHLLFLLRLAAIALLIVAFARPQAGSREEEMITEGIDIILSMDISSSMLAEDFQPKNRLEAAKLVAADFIKGRTNDRIGMVVFSGQSFTQCPLTLDYGILLKFLEEIHVGQIEDGTAIGMGLGTSINRLRDSKAKSKVVILLTDGQNNRGELDPLTAARIAKSFNIRVYTIGAGSKGEALYPVDDPIFGRRYVRMPVNIDEELLRRVADITGGRYFRATDKTSLEKIYKEISEMEKTRIQVKQYTRYRELFSGYLIAALLLLALEVILGNTVFRKIP
ncbi:MAG TPA: VWA domain-containing protein, partial [bacterium]|nr:VWA domain-containing protein [bacterium]